VQRERVHRQWRETRRIPVAKKSVFVEQSRRVKRPNRRVQTSDPGQSWVPVAAAWMLSATVAVFAAALLTAHLGLNHYPELWRDQVDRFAGRQATLVDLPLSMFRDGELNPYGRPLFQLLITIGCLALVSAFANRDVLGLFAYAAATWLLVLVASTPSDDFFHGFCSFLLFAELMLYMAYALVRVHEVWFGRHLGVILAITWCAGSRSYGVWQKSMILYLLFGLSLVAHASLPWQYGSTKPRLCGRKKLRPDPVAVERPWRRASGAGNPRRRP
jgi:hypothetical protein